MRTVAKVLVRVAILLAVAVAVTLGLGWLRDHNLLPGQATLAAGERFGPRGEFRPDFSGESERGAPVGFREGEFLRHREGHGEGPSLAGSIEMVGTVAKMGVVAAPVVLTDALVRRRRHRTSRRRGAG